MLTYYNSHQYSDAINKEINELLARAHLSGNMPAPPDWFERRDEPFKQRHPWRSPEEIVTMEAGWYFIEQYDMLSALPDPTKMPEELPLQWWVREISGRMVWAQPHAVVDLADAEPRRPIAGRMQRLGRLSETIEPFFSDAEMDILKPWCGHHPSSCHKFGFHSEVLAMRNRLKASLSRKMGEKK